jgi:hypothetical protein
MRNDPEHVSSDTDQKSGDSLRAPAAPLRKAWVTPKVITSAMVADAAHSSSVGNDGGGSSTIS